MSKLIVIGAGASAPCVLQEIYKISLVCLVRARRSRSHRRQLRQKTGLLVKFLLHNHTRSRETVHFQTVCNLHNIGLVYLYH